jgi:acetyl coenzyme A synthetase (ADP forming)-like protein
MGDSSLAPFLHPQGIALVGVSHDPTKLGYALARNLTASGYSGAMHFINPKGGRLLGRPIYPSLAQVPDPVDLAVLLVPPLLVPGVLEECAARGIHAVIISTGGFQETGAEGAALEQRCLETARRHGMRLIGPNCVGLINTHLPLDTTFLQPPPPPAGGVAFISHSGGVCAAVIDWIRGQGFGLSQLASLGNQADINETDMLGPLADDPYTRVITLYLEGVSNGRRFMEEARRVSRQVPLLALKMGRFASGQRAAASHTGALAGAEAAFDAAFARGGVIRAATIQEMFQWACALAWSPLPQSRRTAVLTNAGGPGVVCADALELNGLHLADLSEATRAALQAVLPAAASLHNPVDMLGSALPEDYAECLRILLADPGVDSVIVIAPPPPPSSAGAVAKAILPLIQVSEKPVLPVWMGEKLIQEAVEFCRALQVAEYRFPEDAASALGVLARRADLLQRLDEEPVTLSETDPEAARRLLEGCPAGTFLPQPVVNGLLRAYAIPTAEPRLAACAEDAAALAGQAGYPVALKVASADIAHKSDVGGVLLDLGDADVVQAGFERVVANARAARPQAVIEGVFVQRMLPAGQEVIAGVVRDPQFGPLVMFGSGGVEVEGLKDVAFGLAPLTASELDHMLADTWAGRKLAGYRSLPPADRAAVREVLARLAQLAHDCPQIAEIEINPLRVLPAGQGAVAIDVRARLV